MSLLSVAYLLIAIISVGVTIFDIIQVRIHAQPKVWRILLYLAVAAFSLVLSAAPLLSLCLSVLPAGRRVLLMLR